jgi:hypothetical protein
MLYRATATTLLALLFSYLILIDLNKLKAGIGRLRTSRVGDFYEEAGAADSALRNPARPSDRSAGRDRGRSIPMLTLIGLLLLGIPAHSDAVRHRFRLQLRARARRVHLDDARSFSWR